MKLKVCYKWLFDYDVSIRGITYVILKMERKGENMKKLLSLLAVSLALTAVTGCGNA